MALNVDVILDGQVKWPAVELDGILFDAKEPISLGCYRMCVLESKRKWNARMR